MAMPLMPDDTIGASVLGGDKARCQKRWQKGRKLGLAQHSREHNCLDFFNVGCDETAWNIISVLKLFRSLFKIEFEAN
jgi:hypothetical protein